MVDINAVRDEAGIEVEWDEFCYRSGRSTQSSTECSSLKLSNYDSVSVVQPPEFETSMELLFPIRCRFAGLFEEIGQGNARRESLTTSEKQQADRLFELTMNSLVNGKATCLEQGFHGDKCLAPGEYRGAAASPWIRFEGEWYLQIQGQRLQVIRPDGNCWTSDGERPTNTASMELRF